MQSRRVEFSLDHRDWGLVFFLAPGRYDPKFILLLTSVPQAAKTNSTKFDDRISSLVS
jgi:hypothetical protein